jgi:hypothetical protein
MSDRDLVQAGVRELARRDWDLGSIEARYRTLLAEVIPRRRFDRQVVLSRQAELLDRVRRRADDPTDYQATGAAMTAARDFISRFEAVLASTLCPKIQEDMIFGRYMDARACRENFEAFQRELGYAKCALPAGVGARLAAEIILQSMSAPPRTANQGSVTF